MLILGRHEGVRSYYSYGKVSPVGSPTAECNGRMAFPTMYRDTVSRSSRSAYYDRTVAGNTITIELGGGQFEYYMHLTGEVLRLKEGDRVRSGQCWRASAPRR